MLLGPTVQMERAAAITVALDTGVLMLLMSVRNVWLGKTVPTVQQIHQTAQPDTTAFKGTMDVLLAFLELMHHQLEVPAVQFAQLVQIAQTRLLIHQAAQLELTVMRGIMDVKHAEKESTLSPDSQTVVLVWKVETAPFLQRQLSVTQAGTVQLVLLPVQCVLVEHTVHLAQEAALLAQLGRIVQALPECLLTVLRGHIVRLDGMVARPVFQDTTAVKEVHHVQCVWQVKTAVAQLVTHQVVQQGLTVGMEILAAHLAQTAITVHQLDQVTAPYAQLEKIVPTRQWIPLIVELEDIVQRGHHIVPTVQMDSIIPSWLQTFVPFVQLERTVLIPQLNQLFAQQVLSVRKEWQFVHHVQQVITAPVTLTIVLYAQLARIVQTRL